MRARIIKWARACRDTLLPQRCELCRLPSDNALPLCGYCKASLWRNIHACATCAIPLPASSTVQRFCPSCQAKPPPFSSTFAPFVYDASLAYLVGRWKYQRRVHVGSLLACLWLESAATLPEVDLIVTTPIHWARRLHRGFNQTELLLGDLRSHNDVLRSIQCDYRRLHKSRLTRRQVGLSAQVRKRALLGAFTVNERCDNLRVAVIDDVVTTGATASAMSRALLNAGARDVHIWCLARTPPPELTST